MEEIDQLLLVFRSGCFGVQFSADTMNIPLRNWNLAQKRFIGHAKVAVRIVRWNVTLVAKKNMNTVPGQFFMLTRQQGIDSARRIAAGESNGKPSALLNCGFCHPTK